MVKNAPRQKLYKTNQSLVTHFSLPPYLSKITDYKDQQAPHCCFSSLSHIRKWLLYPSL